MKTVKHIFLLSIIPVLSPLTAFAEVEKQEELITPIPGTKGSAASWRVSQVMGLNVKNATDDTIGEVKDLVIDMKSGTILAVIISSGGFLGLADTLSAVPVTSLRYDDPTKSFKTRLTKEQLEKAPQFKTDAWPDYNKASSTEALRSYRDLIGNEVTAPDNTAQNEKEMDQNAVNPTDQGGSVKDMQITKDIRAELMGEDLSFNAKNIKIITQNEFVTLKGVVETDAEHHAILKIARNHANSAKIIDDLKVKAK
jgi:sporulation protein YlmC with PRC-barrel domain